MSVVKKRSVISCTELSILLVIAIIIALPLLSEGSTSEKMIDKLAVVTGANKVTLHTIPYTVLSDVSWI